ncbi:pentapeptide repeat-containing protein [Nocardia sp. NPDC052566]|uniref:pentapeptide repeat-containing protein n=1 Tax=Nocardia sp. NPDC052566 TaxID=3364330 RepID=UPI0037CCBDCE
MPNKLEDLPYARYLTPFEGELEPEGEYECAQISGVFEDAHIGYARFSESAFTGVVATRGSMRFAQFADVWLRDVRWVGTDVSDTAWRDSEMIAGALSGVDLAGSQLRRLRFEGCKFDSVNFRKSNLRDVEFVDCVLRHADFADASLTNVRFPGSILDEITLSRAELTKVDLRGAHAIGIAEGMEALRGATITPGQLMDLAPAFARHFGIVVR